MKVRFLQEQARKVLEDARLNALLHQTSCNFKKIPGSTYYVYKQRKYPDKEFISMISPEVTNRLIMSQRCTAYSRGGVRHELPKLFFKILILNLDQKHHWNLDFKIAVTEEKFHNFSKPQEIKANNLTILTQD